MNKIAYIAFVFAVAAVVAASGCTSGNQPAGGSQQNSQPSGSTDLTLATCQAYSDQESDDAANCYSTLARQEEDFSICENIRGATNEATIEACYTEVALALQDESVCDEMVLPYAEDYQVEIIIENCKYQVRNVAGTGTQPGTSGSTGTLSDCQGYENQEMMAAATCYYKLAVKEIDYTICENIIGETNKQTRIMCFNEVAKAAGDASICDEMTVPDYAYLDMAKQQCKSYAS